VNNDNNNNHNNFYGTVMRTLMTDSRALYTQFIWRMHVATLPSGRRPSDHANRPGL